MLQGAEQAAEELRSVVDNLTTVPHIMAQPPRRSLLLRAQKSMGRSMLNLLATPNQGSSTRRRRSTFMGTSSSSDKPVDSLRVGGHFLLYLNNKTFVGEEGLTLAAEMQMVLNAGMRVVMVHENDIERGGCAFSYFFQVLSVPTLHILVTLAMPRVLYSICVTV